MRVRGEAFVAFSFLMNCLCLLAAPVLLGLRARPRRLALTALLFSILSVPLLLLSPVFRSPPVVLLTPLPMAAMAFCREHCLSAAFITLITGFLLRGLADYLLALNVAPFLCVVVCAIPFCALPLIKKARLTPKKAVLFLTVLGKTFEAPAIVDTGNRLSDGKTAVLVLPRKLLPVCLNETLTSLPRGFCLLPAQTVTGHTLLPAFFPEKAEIAAGETRIPLSGVRIALAPEGEYALIPPCLMERSRHYVRRKTVGMADQAGALRPGIHD